MKYTATIIINGNKISRDFTTIFDAAQWLDSENNNLDAIAMIETFDEAGNKKDGFFYLEKTR